VIMIIWDLMRLVSENNVFIREWLNGCLIPLNLSMILIITYTVWRQTGFAYGWSKYPGANSACALWWIFFADLMRAVLAWTILRATELNPQAFVTYQTMPGATIGYMVVAVISTCATFRCIYCLTPGKWRHFTWIMTALFSAAFIVVSYMGAFDWLGDYVIYQVTHTYWVRLG